ncbi:methyltransferase domain-containing protein [Pseudoruegeria sp. SK021]|uniref:methyltransferase domain-containing protein n=1 Tax=Pseudoruegeria sp. SK021 TaxID=1933035 RepID=UPI000A243683|nr:methyltransferase domain-containing protein [Pseudoruegeria sp. SK021]OSP55309.1 methyltransferase [Pseudoruegeria sp. SK021]
MGVGQDISAGNAGWTFGDNVPDTFVDHIKLSVPLYEDGHKLTCQLSDFFVKNDSLVYEIGTSTGELIRKLAVHNAMKRGARWVGLDIEPSMIKAATDHCKDVPTIKIMKEDARFMDMERADMIVSYYTMQFVPPRFRQDLFTKIYETLNWGGALIMFEKVRGPDARFQDIISQLYNDFKIQNGFSSEEVVEKARSLKGILEPFSTQGNLDLMRRAGFQDVVTVQKYLCFEGFLAIK